MHFIIFWFTLVNNRNLSFSYIIAQLSSNKQPNILTIPEITSLTNWPFPCWILLKITKAKMSHISGTGSTKVWIKKNDGKKFFGETFLGKDPLKKFHIVIQNWISESSSIIKNYQVFYFKLYYSRLVITDFHATLFFSLLRCA